MTGAELNDKSEQSSAALALLIVEWMHSQREDRIIYTIFITCTYRFRVVISVRLTFYSINVSL